MRETKEYFGRSGAPTAQRGQVIGLLGGSFDPAHQGHAHITLHALKRFNLDQVWWLVSPGNPLKSVGPAPLLRRMQTANDVIDHPNVKITDLESRLRTRYTAQTMQALMAYYPGANFVWLMGADNLIEFHKWDRWRWIMENVPIGILARPGDRLAARHSKAATQYAFAQIRGQESRLLAKFKPPCWCFINVPMVNMSSTKIRAQGEWAR